MDNDLFQRIRNFEQKITGKQKILAQYLLLNSEEISFQTVAGVARKAGVGDSTVVRFSRALGYEGFPELREEFQRAILENLTPSERLHRVIDFPQNLGELVSRVFEKEIQNLKETEKGLEIGNIEKIANCIVKAKRKYVVGLRASSACAYLLGRFLTQILPNVVSILSGDSHLFEGLKAIDKDDIIIVISFPRYTKLTVEAVQFARDHKANTVAITDSKLSPAAQVSKFVLVAPASSYNFANSYIGCVSIINLLITLIIHIDKDQTAMMLREWEKAVERFNFQY